MENEMLFAALALTEEKEDMVSIRFASLVLGLLLLAFAALRVDSMALAHNHQEVRMANGIGFVAVGVKSASVDQGQFRDATEMEARRAWTNGRKMLMKEKIKEEDVNGDPSKITGKGKHASEKSLGRPATNMNDEIRRKLFNLKSLNYVDMGTIGSSHERLDQAPGSHAPLDRATQTTKSKKLHESSMDTMNMLSMDYNHTPRRTPPINNGQPLNEKLSEP